MKEEAKLYFYECGCSGKMEEHIKKKIYMKITICLIFSFKSILSSFASIHSQRSRIDRPSFATTHIFRKTVIFVGNKQVFNILKIVL